MSGSIIDMNLPQKDTFPVWRPGETQFSSIRKYIAFLRSAHPDAVFHDYDSLHEWSINNIEKFWQSFAEFSALSFIKPPRNGTPVVSGWRPDLPISQRNLQKAEFFQGTTLNYAENLLRPSMHAIMTPYVPPAPPPEAADGEAPPRRKKTKKTINPLAPAIIGLTEQPLESYINHAELVIAVTALQKYFEQCGVTRGVTVSACLPNCIEAMVCCLAVTSLGGVWSSCSPDFGASGQIDRFEQVEPMVFITCDQYWYNSKANNVLSVAGEVIAKLPTVAHVLVVPFCARHNIANKDHRELEQACGGFLHDSVLPPPIEVFDVIYANFLLFAVPEAANPFARIAAPPYESEASDTQVLGKARKILAEGELRWEEVSFSDPLFIMFSSGTTGRPKSIVHGVGGTLIQHLKEHMLHCDLQTGDRLFFYTTAGWMMWNWMFSALAGGVTVVAYDGSPFLPAKTHLLDICGKYGITHFGVSAKYIESAAKSFITSKGIDLSALKVIMSTGSPLSKEGFWYVYENWSNVPRLSSIAGGTDIMGCFTGGSPVNLVYPGCTQVNCLGMDVRVYDENGHDVGIEKQGELVCTTPHPSMPLYFLNDKEGQKYHEAYFARFPGVWHHGDWITRHQHGGITFHGRSDATLNPRGVRIGTAEIYRQMEMFSEVVDCVVVGQEWDDDTRIVLFVQLQPGLILDNHMIEAYRAYIRRNASPRHAPAVILQVNGIPRTKSGKVVELAVREAIHGRPVKNLHALVDAEVMSEYHNRHELR